MGGAVVATAAVGMMLSVVLVGIVVAVGGSVVVAAVGMLLSAVLVGIVVAVGGAAVVAMMVGVVEIVVALCLSNSLKEQIKVFYLFIHSN
jgi:hypothetical protein